VGYFKPEKIEVTTKKKERELGPLKNLSYYMADDFCETTDEEFPINDFPS
jgi:hypothetical protein